MTEFEAYISPARTRPGLWRILIGMAIIIGFWLIGTLVVLVAVAVVNFLRLGDLEAALASVDAIGAGGTPTTIAVMLASFWGVWLGVLVAVKALHGQPFYTIFAPVRRIAWRDFGIGLAMAACFALPSGLAGMLVAEPVRNTLPLWQWALWLVPVVGLIFVQATSEELIFRGYLLQQLALRSASPLVWAGIPAVGFGLMHFANGAADGAGVSYVLVTALMGLTLAALVWRTGNLWAATGLHLGVNTVSLTVIGADGMLGGTQLWLFPAGGLAEMLHLDLIVVALMLGFVLSPLGRIIGTAGSTQAGVLARES